MPSKVYDTRFFVELFYSKDKDQRNRLNTQKTTTQKYASNITIHEIYQLTIAKEGRETAKTRTALIAKTFTLIPVDEQIAQTSAELRHKYKLSMGDSMIAATAQKLNAACITDDPHFQQIKEIKTTWI